MPPYRTNLNNPIWANNMWHYNSIKDVVIPYDNNPYRTDYTNIPEVIDGPIDAAGRDIVKNKNIINTESAPSPLSLGIAAAETLGTTINTLANRSIEENNQYNPDASIIGTTSWGDVLNADQRITEGINNIQESTDDYSGYNSIDTLKNAWNPTQRQQLEGISDLQRTGNLFGDVISGGAKGATVGSMFGPVGTAVGSIAGAAIEGVKDLFGFAQQDEAIEEANKAIARANSDSRANFYNTSDNIVKRNNRNYWLNNIMAEGGLLNEFNVGGTHEQNPYGGIQQGIAQDGLPNLVEEGEVRSDFDDAKILNNKDEYRLTEKACEEYGLPKSVIGCTPAEAEKKLSKEYKDRPNDPISIATMKDWDAKIFRYQEDKTAEKEAKQLTKEFNALPYEAKLAMAEDAYQQQLPLDELNAEQPVFAKGGKIYIKPKNRGKFTALKKRTGKSASWFKAHGTPAQKKMATFALNAKKWSHKHDDGGHLFPLGGYPFGALGIGAQYLTSGQYEKDKALTNYFNNIPNFISSLPEFTITGEKTEPVAHLTAVKPEDIPEPKGPIYDTSGLEEAIEDIARREAKNTNINIEDLRYAPAFGAGLGTLVAALQPKDYTLANRYKQLASELKPTSAPHIGGYRRYTPYDVNLGDVENLALTSRAISANRGQNRATQGALNSAAINAMQKANALRNLEWQKANEANRLAVDQYNLGIDQFNAQRDTQYDQLNQQILNSKLNLLAQAAQAEDASKTAWANMLNTTSTNMFNQLGNVGKDTWAKNQRDAMLYNLGYDPNALLALDRLAEWYSNYNS